MGFGGMFNSDSKASESNAAADNQSKIFSGKGNVNNESGGLLISGSNLTDNSRTDLNSGVKITGGNSGNITIESDGGEALTSLSEYFAVASAAAEKANQVNQSFFGDLIKKIGDVVKEKSDVVTDDLITDAPTAGKKSNWLLWLGGLAALGLAGWLLFGGKKRA
jgi:LPXTG-motif cell wall-anchored protein